MTNGADDFVCHITRSSFLPPHAITDALLAALDATAAFGNGAERAKGGKSVEDEDEKEDEAALLGPEAFLGAVTGAYADPAAAALRSEAGAETRALRSRLLSGTAPTNKVGGPTTQPQWACDWNAALEFISSFFSEGSCRRASGSVSP